MAAGWNSRNRRVAKQRSKTSWYKGKAEVEPPPSIQEEENAARFSIHKECPNQPNIVSGGSRQGQSLFRLELVMMGIPKWKVLSKGHQEQKLEQARRLKGRLERNGTKRKREGQTDRQ
jgi:hypothetical protein